MLTPFAVEKYVVWLSTDDLTVRVDATGTGFGQRVVSQRDFTNWGDPVEITPPL